MVEIKAFIRSYSRIAWLIIIGMTILLFDFVSKAYVYHVLPFYNPSTGIVEGYHIPIFNNFFGIDFALSMAINTGAAWGMFSNFQILLLILRMGVVGGMFIYLFFLNQKRGNTLPLVLIISGALGNILDYFLYGFVIDFLHFTFWGYHFPIFNLADTSITLGVIFLCASAFFKGSGKKNTVSSYVNQ